jgi:hypothetical protein
MSIVLIDTSVFCNIIPVPGLDQDRNEVMKELTRNIEENATLLLPMATILETGNHIAHLTGGQVRRKVAGWFCVEVKKALEGKSPWTPTSFWEQDELFHWLREFPDHAMRRTGMGDLSIIKEWERQCLLHRARRILIWSLDRRNVDGFDRRAAH